MSIFNRDFFDFVLDNGEQLRISKGDNLKDSSYIYIVSDGIVAEYKGDVIIDIYRRKETLYLNGTFAVCLSSGKLYRIKKSMLSNYNDYLFKIVDYKSQHLIGKLHNICTGRVEKRLADLLCSFGDKYGIHNGRSVFVPFSMSRSRISDMINCRAETVSRIFSDWESKSFIEISKEGFDLCNLHQQKF